MSSTPTISLCMIVKDEETYLAQCFDSVKDVVDEIIVVDTGSTDQTQAICQRYHVPFHSYSWDDDFSKARNHSLNFAQSDWILILDADEIIDQKKDDFISLLQGSTTDSYIVTIYNYTGELDEGEYSIHHSLRLFRNHHGFCFQGAIHEQVISCDHPEQPLTCEVSPLIIRHFGYLTKVIDEKRKRSRNLPLLQNQLEAEPNNAFVLFNLGNEYSALEQYDQALNLYQLAKRNLDGQEAFAAYLYFRMVMCFSYLNRNQEVVNLVIEVRKEFPDFTDIVYCSGLAYYHMHQYTKALDLFDQCIRMGPSPPLQTFLNGCATFLPYQAKAEIYKRLNDLESALECLFKAYQYKKGNTEILYDIGHLLNRLYQDKEFVVSRLVHISKEKDTTNLYECVDILIGEQLYFAATSLLSTLDSDGVDTLFVKGKLKFFNHEFTQATNYFHQVLSLSHKNKHLMESISYLFVVGILTNQEELPNLLHPLQAKVSPNVYQAYKNIIDLQLHQENSNETSNQTSNQTLNHTSTILLEILEKLLKLQAYDQFETYLTLLNQVENQNTLLELGRLYERCGYSKLAQITYYRSLKERNVIDMAALDYLASGLLSL